MSRCMKGDDVGADEFLDQRGSEKFSNKQTIFRAQNKKKLLK